MKLALAACNTFMTGLDLETLIDKLTYGPRAITGIGSEGIVASASCPSRIRAGYRVCIWWKPFDHKTTHFWSKTLRVKLLYY